MRAIEDNSGISEYVLSDSIHMSPAECLIEDAVLIAYLDYERLFDECISCLCEVPTEIDIHIITTSAEKRRQIEEICLKKRAAYKEIQIVKTVEWRPDTLFTTCAEIWKKYSYFCLIQDRVMSENVYPKKIEETCIFLTWENLLKNEIYIRNLWYFLKTHERLGMLIPPAPYHADHFINYGKNTEAYRCQSVSESAFWCRTAALFTLERRRPAERECYEMAIVMSDSFASIQASNYQLLLNNLVKKKTETICFETYEDLVFHENYLNCGKIMKFFESCEQKYVYGIGPISSQASAYLQSQEIPYDGYIVTDGCDHPESFCSKPVLKLSSVPPKEGTGIVIAVNMKNTTEIVSALKERGFRHLYFNQTDERIHA